MAGLASQSPLERYRCRGKKLFTPFLLNFQSLSYTCRDGLRRGDRPSDPGPYNLAICRPGNLFVLAVPDWPTCKSGFVLSWLMLKVFLFKMVVLKRVLLRPSARPPLPRGRELLQAHLPREKVRPLRRRGQPLEQAPGPAASSHHPGFKEMSDPTFSSNGLTFSLGLSTITMKSG